MVTGFEASSVEKVRAGWSMSAIEMGEIQRSDVCYLAPRRQSLDLGRE